MIMKSDKLFMRVLYDKSDLIVDLTSVADT